jgi:GNAT superfamily N-acetyltransferase
METDMTLSQTYFTHNSPLGVIYEAIPLSAEYVAAHTHVLHETNSGTDIRVNILDPNEDRKFIQKLPLPGIYLSEDGEKGLIGYYDYRLEDDGTVTSRAFYIHPQHRNRGIMRDVLFYVVGLAEDGTSYNPHLIANKDICKVVDDLIAYFAAENRDVIINYTKGYIE